MPKKNVGKKSSQEHIELQKALVKRLIILLGIVVIIIVTLTFFTPVLGAFFGFLAKNEENTQQQIKPNPPLLVKIPEATKDNSINITGYGQSGLMVKLYVNGPEVASNVVGSDGVFTFEGIKLIKGRNTIFARVSDNFGEESEKSATYIVNVDTDKPDLEITSPKDGDIIKNLDDRIKISGKVNEKAEVKVNSRLAIVKPDLTFDFLLGVSEGNIKITVEAKDIAGNETKKEITVEYKKDN